MDYILENEWLSRAWTFQEFALSRDIVLLCRMEDITWELFLGAFWFFPERSQWHAPSQTWPGLTRVHIDSQGRKQEFELREKTVTASLVWRRLFSGILSLIYIAFAGFPIWLWLDLWYRQDNMNILYCMIGIAGAGMLGWLVLTFCHSVLAGSTPKVPSWEHQSFARSGVVNSVRRALIDRQGYSPHDRCFSLYGVFERYGLVAPLPDYTQTSLKVFRSYFTFLITWDPHYLVLLVDASIDAGAVGSPSWVPDWAMDMKHSVWLPSVMTLSRAAVIKRDQQSSAWEPWDRTRPEQLHLPVERLGHVTFRGVFDHEQDWSSDEVVKAALGGFAAFLHKVLIPVWKAPRKRH